MSSLTPASTTIPQQTDAGTKVTDIQVLRDRLKELFVHPELLPDGFLAFVTDFVSVNQPYIPISQVFGFKSTLVGQVDSTGGITAGTGFTINKSATGTYVITFGNQYAATPTVIATPFNAGSNNRTALVSAASTTSATVFLQNPSTGTAADCGFNFAVFST